MYAAARTTPWDKVYGLSWKETLTDFRDQPVAVLGMNIDPNDNDAWFVVHALSLEHPTLKAQTLAASMNITACPATVVIDRDGKVAHIQIGYSRTRRDDLRKIISPLLKAPR